MEQQIIKIEQQIQNLQRQIETLNEMLYSKLTTQKLFSSSGVFLKQIDFTEVPNVGDAVVITSSNISSYAQTQYMFTLQNLLGTATLTPNSITSTEEDNTVVTLEKYYPAFLTFSVGFQSVTNVTIFGFVVPTLPNTFAFAFQFLESSYHFVSNGAGTIGEPVSYSVNDIFTVALTSTHCYYYQNGLLVNTVLNTQNSPPYRGQFYFGDANLSLNNIAYGIMNPDPPLVG